MRNPGFDSGCLKSFLIRINNYILLGVTAHREGINGEDNIFSCAFCSTTIKYIDHAPHDVETSNCSDWGKGLHNTEVACLLLSQQLQVRFSEFPNFSEEKLLMSLRLIDGAG